MTDDPIRDRKVHQVEVRRKGEIERCSDTAIRQAEFIAQIAAINPNVARYCAERLRKEQSNGQS